MAFDTYLDSDHESIFRLNLMERISSVDPMIRDFAAAWLKPNW